MFYVLVQVYCNRLLIHVVLFLNRFHYLFKNGIYYGWIWMDMDGYGWIWMDIEIRERREGEK